MSDPTMLIGRNRRGRPPRAAVRATRRIEFFVTPAEGEQLARVAADEGKALATVIREAVNEFVADYQDREVFTTKTQR